MSLRPLILQRICRRISSHLPHNLRARQQWSDAGFTLVELMVTVTCILVLSALAVPKFSGYIRQARLEAAKPYLMQIAARQRMFKLEIGQYCCTNSGSNSNSNENTLATNLGVSLGDVGDFCFVFICQSSTLCQSTSGTGFITSSGTAPDFEVWGILQDASGTTASGPGGTSCTPSTAKIAATGWIAPSGSTSAGRAGQVVVLRYPPPLNGQGNTGSFSPHTGLTFNWMDGFSISDAMFP